ncbi:MULTISPECIES: tRNA (adenosine(37)-N6)-threonylcarbamoyltransferase complex ATPase subunit type 1 TsaE [unclassified Fusibacter]|uniref:tRNA (adenosine(37)-N6)-threonylcarbamoyltransferase complex ATPase subunit type 1 TsaE n=1 Tax=unclassified Fusibacter TaxID=2624464 RepID=UPI00101241E2|nr:MULTISPECIES: tRNA (adenosine(37)-N6)-threonylcarbamoyltransferase complex ATPase subunit type 1 TsaE [unclassified Fusibacter]MCK8059438.1 tRNA (adenosine(37)-N6)-threonylcarbamoyltransferase complex ATPase subunit type 1 TsaE [Fusibacter sp. A2]NPE21098.1 tRNA (adenosine(37)-N6)-threonylcarbamoyltransferase complex ATPase subunit type 1 TsaE [Fusibacter sp. A1]RXV62370.1 tRNA (adenosine(37)-N6)-threonylcarbamoyltransferase complex ATPase subunit type 1 TsaE [Fusibacter sp. A1]
MRIHAKNEEMMMHVGHLIAGKLSKGDVVALIGDLGTGKTTLTKAIGEALNIPGYMASPSYNIVNAYECSLGPLYHADVYRIDTIDSLDEIGFFEYLHEGGIVLIEWADKILDELKVETDQLILITIDNHEEGRILELNGYKSFDFEIKE